MFHGLSAFPVTPADAAGRVDTAHLQTLIANLNRDGVSSIGVLGSTGNYMYLSQAERARALEAALVATDKPVLAGIGALTTREVLANAETAERLGASAVLLACPSYLPLTDTDVVELFSDVSAATTLPICIYNNPGTTGVTMSLALQTRLAQIPRVVAVKNPAPAKDASAHVEAVREATPNGFAVGYSGDALIPNVLSAGADGWYSVLAGTHPEACIAIWNARHDAAELARLHQELDGLWSLFKTLGGIRVVFEMIEILGLGRITPPRPLLPLGPEVRREIAAALEKAHAIDPAQLNERATI